MTPEAVAAQLELVERFTWPPQRRHQRDARLEVLLYRHPPTGRMVRLELPRRPKKALQQSLAEAPLLAARKLLRDLEQLALFPQDSTDEHRRAGPRPEGLAM